MAKREGNIVGAERAFFGCLEWRDDGRIAALNEYEPVRGDAAWLLPGFVDLHLHGVGQGNAESEAGIRAMAEFEPATGVTGFCPTLDTEDAEATREYLENVRRTAGGVPGGARVLGAHLEGPYLDYAHRGGMNPECLRAPDIHEVERWLACAQGTLKLVTLAPELPGAAAVCRLLRASGVTVAAGHTGLRAGELAGAVAAGVRHICHLFDTFDGRETCYGVSQPALADVVLLEDQLTLELIADGVHVAPELLRLAHRAAGAARIVVISDAMEGTGLPDAIYRQPDGRRFKLTNGDVCRLVDDPNTIVGSCLTLNRGFYNLTRRFGFTPVEAAAALATNAARVLGLAGQTGVLSVGAAADLAILEPDAVTVRETVLAGRTIYSP